MREKYFLKAGEVFHPGTSTYGPYVDNRTYNEGFIKRTDGTKARASRVEYPSGKVIYRLLE